MRRAAGYALLSLLVFSFSVFAQLDKIVIPAGTPEDQALTAISNEPDAQKKLAMYEDFVQKFSSNPAAVAYGNWQIAQCVPDRWQSGKGVELRRQGVGCHAE